MFLTKKKKNRIAKGLALIQTVLNKAFTGETDPDAIECWELSTRHLQRVAEEIGGVKLMELTKFWYDILAERIDSYDTK